MPGGPHSLPDLPSGAPAGPRVLLYALGGGLGHATRALALGRQLAARGARPHLLIGSPLAAALPLPGELGPGGAVTRLDPARGAPALRAAVRELIAGRRWDALVIDTFPRGLLGELPPLLAEAAALRVWVQRDLSPRYLTWALAQGGLPAYDLILRPGEAPEDLGPAAAGAVTRTAPWLVRARHELLTPGAARAALDATGAGPLIAVVGCGTAAELRGAGRFAQELRRRLADGPPAGARPQMRFLAPPGAVEDALDPRWVWPLLAHLPGVDLLIGAGGYHTVHEARATATPLLALPRPRLYDRQARRLSSAERVATPAALLARALELATRLTARGPVPDFPCGAAQGAAALLAALDRSLVPLAPVEV